MATVLDGHGGLLAMTSNSTSWGTKTLTHESTPNIVAFHAAVMDWYLLEFDCSPQ